MQLTPWRSLLYTLPLTLLLVGCGPRSDDDDDSALDDDDSALGDDDDATAPSNHCAALDAALTDLNTWPLLTSCSYFFSASTAANDYRLALSFGVAEATTPTAGMSFVLSFDGSTVANQVTGALQTQRGSNLNLWDCNDALDPSQEPLVTDQWDPVAGTATLHVTSVNGEAWPGGPTLFTGDVSLQGIEVQPSTRQSESCAVPDTTWVDRGFGWLAG